MKKRSTSLAANAAKSVDDGYGPIGYTNHAEFRRVQRNLTRAEVNYVLRHGSWSRTEGCDLILLRRHDLPDEHRAIKPLARLVGTVVLLAPSGCVITVYRGGNFRKVRKMPKVRPAKVHPGDSFLLPAA